MAPAAQITTWSKVLCCRICAKHFGLNELPLNLSRGHTICRNCLRKLGINACPSDQHCAMKSCGNLRNNYPQMSKTCVGHVVQLLYRSSCFNLLRREGKSSLVQLKTEFRDYDALRREHDMQIVQMAQEEGLRLSTSQWSWLLYADQDHRTYMQSITDKLQVAHGLEQQIDYLKTVIDQSGEPELLIETIGHFEHFGNFDYFLEKFKKSGIRKDSGIWPVTVDFFSSLSYIVKAYVKFMQKKTVKRTALPTGNSLPKKSRRKICYYKIKLRHYAEAPLECPRCRRCLYAHGVNELRPLPPKSPQEPSVPPRTTTFHSLRRAGKHGYIPPNGQFMNPFGNIMSQFPYPPPQQSSEVPDMSFLPMMMPPWLPYETVARTPAAPVRMESTFPAPSSSHMLPPYQHYPTDGGSYQMYGAQSNALMAYGNIYHMTNGIPAVGRIETCMRNDLEDAARESVPAELMLV